MAAEPDIIDYEERRQKGLALYAEIMQQEHPALLSPRSATLIDFVYAEIWSRPGITRRERRLITLACTAGVDALATFADHVYGALKSGDLSPSELDEFVLHFAVYCGWGKAETIERIIDEQTERLKAEGAVIASPRTPQPLTTVPEDQELRKQGGEQEFRDTNAVPSPTRGVPYYDNGILNFVFGDMWKRPGLSRRDRRWVTLACVGLDDTMTPVQSHIYSAMKTKDIDVEEMREMVLQFAAYCGWPKGSLMQRTVDDTYEQIAQEA